MTLYKITSDLLSITELFETAVDENGNPRDLTESEMEFLKKEMATSQEDFEKKFDGYGKIISNLKSCSEIAESERKTFKSEMDRLSNRSKVFNNRVDSIKNALRYSMELLNIQKYKSALFSAGIQNTQDSITFNGEIKNIPEKYLKPRELSVSSIKADIKAGILEVHGGMVMVKESGEILDGVNVLKGTTLVVR